MIYKKDNVEKIVMDSAAAARLEKQGFVCIAGAPERKVQEVKKKDLTGMTVQELRAMARDKGIKGASALNKKDLIQVLQ